MGRINRRQVIKAGLGVIGLAASSKFSFAVAQREEPLRIGVVLSYSGPYARLGQEITRGMELYLERVNLQAGGRRIQLLKEDEEADPAVALRKVRKLVEQDRVDLLAGIILSSSAYAIRDRRRSPSAEAMSLPLGTSRSLCPQRCASSLR
jgi:branched-chain amino acid transport system substrate-binding protein